MENKLGEREVNQCLEKQVQEHVKLTYAWENWYGSKWNEHMHEKTSKGVSVSQQMQDKANKGISGMNTYHTWEKSKGLGQWKRKKKKSSTDVNTVNQDLSTKY